MWLEDNTLYIIPCDQIHDLIVQMRRTVVAETNGRKVVEFHRLMSINLRNNSVQSSPMISHVIYDVLLSLIRKF
jgi:hypothetical protein